MEFSEPSKYSRDPKFLGTPDNTAAYRSRLSTKLEAIFMSDNPTLSYADFQHQIARNAGSYLPKSSGVQQSCAVDGKAEEDELVRYMSNLPSYLEKGKSFQEKPLNIGVLDWRHLETWKYNNDLMPQKSSDYSSTSRTSNFSTEGPASRPCRVQSSSPGRQRVHCSSSPSHLEASPMKAHSQAKCYTGKGHSCSPARQRTFHLVPHSHHEKIFPWESESQNVHRTTPTTDKFGEISPSISNHRVTQKNVCGMDKTSRRDQSGVRQEMCDKKEFVSTTTSEIGKWQTWDNANVASSSKGKLRIRESELKDAMQSWTPNQDRRPDFFEKRNAVVLLLPKDSPTNRGSTQLSDSAVSASLVQREFGRRKSSSKNDNHKEPHGCVPSCPQQVQDDSQRRLEVRESYSTSTLGMKLSSQQFNSPARNRNTEERKSIVVLKSPIKTQRTGSESTTRARHPSPIRRLSTAMGNIIRSAGSRDNSPVRRSCSKDPVTKNSSDRAGVSASLEADKSPASCRARSSPLRRLLDPLIKPKATKACESTEPLRKDSALTTRPSKSSDDQLDLLKAQSVKANSTITNGKTMGAKDSHQSGKKGPAPIHALLQVAVNNGLPLFTLAVDNDKAILAATLKKSSSAEKNCSGWIYTFFTVHETKKKNALWRNQGSKGNSHYVPNVIAQMRVSDCQASVRTTQKGTNGEKSREFTLFSVDVDQVDQNATDFQPTDELAAIVVKLPKPSTWSPNDIPVYGCSLEMRDPNSSDTLQDFARNPIITTVILPGGVHTVPSKGSISTLTERWRSGGACDCGGWDLGCQLRIFTNQGESHGSLTPSKTSNISEDFELFSKVGQESQLVLNLNPFKDRIYSVEFDSSISLLQAFAICVSVLDCKRPSGLFTPSNMFEGRSSRARSSVSGDPARMKPRNQSHAEAPATASYVSYPPHSPVERV